MLVTVNVPATAPRTAGVKVALSLQVLPTATVPQVPRLAVNGAPLVVTAVMTSGRVPVFVTRTVLVVLVLVRLVPKATLAIVAVVVGITPVPLTGTLVGDAAALEVMSTLADFKPVVVGAKVTLMVHDPAGATGPKQPLATAVNEVASAPVTVTLLTTRAALPVLLTVMP